MTYDNKFLKIKKENTVILKKES